MPPPNRTITVTSRSLVYRPRALPIPPVIATIEATPSPPVEFSQYNPPQNIANILLFKRSVPMEIDPPFDPTSLGLKEIGNLASWTVSSCKPGCGVEALRDEDTALFWQ